MENGQTYPLKGTLQFSDVTVDESTGSITLRAVFPNPQHTLLPGMFVRARIDEGVQPDAILIPRKPLRQNPRIHRTIFTDLCADCCRNGGVVFTSSVFLLT